MRQETSEEFNLVVSMEPLGKKQNVVDVADLTRWNFTQLLADEEEKPEDTGSKSPFPWRSDLNSKLVLWKGDILTLQVHALVHPTNEMISTKYEMTARLLQEAGPEMLSEINNSVRGSKTGEARLTKGHQLLARHVIHTVGPRFNVKYSTAAEGALFSCYRSVLQLANENNIRTLAMCPIHSSQRGYPLEQGAHIAIRTVRRFLEKFGSNFETIIFACKENDVMETYQHLMPLYFPRNWKEEMEAKEYLPEDIGNENGEPVIAERKIRIIDKPTFAAFKSLGEEFDETIDLNKEFRSPDGPAVGCHEFAVMKEDIDKERLCTLQAKPSAEQLEKERARLYEKFLLRAKQEDLTDIAQLQCIYQSGVDRFGRPVVVFIGRNLPANCIDMERMLLYIVQMMDPIADNHYTVVYLHSLTTADNLPATSFVKYAYNLLHDKYKKNLSSFYIVHPNIWFKISTWFFTTFTASEIKSRVQHLQGTEYLYAYINTDQFDVPQWVFEYDLKVNGPRYYAPPEDTVDEL